MPEKCDDERSEVETEAERDRILKRLLTTPPKPHKPTQPPKEKGQK